MRYFTGSFSSSEYDRRSGWGSAGGNLGRSCHDAFARQQGRVEPVNANAAAAVKQLVMHVKLFYTYKYICTHTPQLLALMFHESVSDAAGAPPNVGALATGG